MSDDRIGLSAGGTRAEMRSFSFDASGAYFLFHQQYADGATPTESALRSEIETEGGWVEGIASEAETVAVDIEEQRSTVRVFVDRDTFVDARSSRSPVPVVTWGLDIGDQYTALRHEAGETVELDNVEVGHTDSLVTDISPGATLEPGDALEFDSEGLRESGTLTLGYETEETSTTTLFDTELDPDQFDSG